MSIFLIFKVNCSFCVHSRVFLLSLCSPLATYRETSMGVKLNFAYQM